MCLLTPKQCLHFAVPPPLPALTIKHVVIIKAFETFTVLCLTSVIINFIRTRWRRTCDGFIIHMHLKGINALILQAE
jgi:hypothetical protein